jgi:hypothetical protein
VVIILLEGFFDPGGVERPLMLQNAVDSERRLDQSALRALTGDGVEGNRGIA